MNDVGVFPAHDSREPPRESEIEIARGGYVVDFRAKRSGLGIDLAVRRADQDVIDVSAAQAVEQVYDLLSASIEMTTGFYVQYFHFCQVVRGLLVWLSPAMAGSYSA
jgi:hypothetical protein